MLKKIAKLKGLEVIPKVRQCEINGGKQVPVDESFACYCNGVYVGEKSSIQDCWDACP